MTKDEERHYPTLKKGPWGAMLHICTHIVIGVFIFVFIAMVALGLGLFVKWVKAQGADPFVVYVLTTVEYFLLVADALLFMYLVGKSILKVGKETEL